MYPTMPTTRQVDATIGGVGDGDDIQVGRRRRGYDVYERLVIVVVCCRGCCPYSFYLNLCNVYFTKVIKIN